MLLSDVQKVLLLGILEGLTEWLPVSSTGHLLLADEWLRLDASAGFKELFFVVIQLGAILAVVVRFWSRLLPVRKAEHGLSWKPETLRLWGRVLLACVPGGLAALLLDDLVERRLKSPIVIALALVVYGLAFLVVERRRRKPRVCEVGQLGLSDAFQIGAFQALSIVPGTSRSGATIVGALTLGVSRTAAAEFSFFLAVPVMLGMSGVKLLKFGLRFTAQEGMLLALGMLAAFLTSMLALGALLRFVQKHDFRPFGWYRIALGAVILYKYLQLWK